MRVLSRAELLKRFGETLSEHRRRAGLSQEKLAARANIDRSYVGGVERGERNVTLVNMVRLAEALNVAPAELLGSLTPDTLNRDVPLKQQAFDILLGDLPEEQVRNGRIFLLGEVERIYASAGHRPPNWVNILRREFTER